MTSAPKSASATAAAGAAMNELMSRTTSPPSGRRRSVAHRIAPLVLQGRDLVALTGRPRARISSLCWPSAGAGLRDPLLGEAEADRIGERARHLGDRGLDDGAAGHRLLVVGHVLRPADDAEGDAVRRQRLAPMLVVAAWRRPRSGWWRARPSACGARSTVAKRGSSISSGRPMVSQTPAPTSCPRARW